MVVVERPFDAKAEYKRGSSNLFNRLKESFSYYSTMRPSEAEATINALTRHNLRDNELLLITVLGHGTYLEKGVEIDNLHPMAFFQNSFAFGYEGTAPETLENALVNMIKRELDPELRMLLRGKYPAYQSRYSGLQVLLSRKNALIPEGITDLPVIHYPEESAADIHARSLARTAIA